MSLVAHLKLEWSFIMDENSWLWFWMYKSWGPQLENLTQSKPQQILVMWMDASPWWLWRCSKSRCGHRSSTNPIVDHIFLAPPNPRWIQYFLKEGKVEKTWNGESSCSRFSNLIRKSD
jgi:hypothetical protein